MSMSLRSYHAAPLLHDDMETRVARPYRSQPVEKGTEFVRRPRRKGEGEASIRGVRGAYSCGEHLRARSPTRAHFAALAARRRFQSWSSKSERAWVPCEAAFPWRTTTSFWLRAT